MSRLSQAGRRAGALDTNAGQFRALLEEFGDLLSDGERELFSDPTRNWGWHASLITLVEVRRVKQELRALRAFVEGAEEAQEARAACGLMFRWIEYYMPGWADRLRHRWPWLSQVRAQECPCEEATKDEEADESSNERSGS